MRNRLNNLKEALDGVPVATMLMEMFAPIKAASAKVNKRVERDETDLSQPKHAALYLGKFIRQGVWERIRRVLNWGAPDRIYSRDTVVTALEELFKRTPEGRPVYVNIIPSLSELCNGPDDVESAYALAEQEAQLWQMVYEYFPSRSADFKVLNPEDFPLHAGLFQAMRANLDADGRVDVEGVCNTENGGVLNNSLGIAKMLWQALQDPKYGGKIKHHCRRMVPEHFRDRCHTEENRLSSYEGYGFFEVAIRLADISAGVNTHIGVERQGVYDVFIAELVKGERGKFKDIKCLVPLFIALERASFTTVYVPKKNEHAQRTHRRNAWIRAASFSTALVAAVGTYDAVQDRQEAHYMALSDAEIRHRLRDIRCYWQDAWMGQVDKANDLRSFRRAVDYMQLHLGLRYNLEDEVVQRLEPFIENYVLYNGDAICFEYGLHEKLVDHVDRFAQEHRALLLRWGVDSPESPYSHVLAEHKVSFEEILEEESDLSVNTRPMSGDPRDYALNHVDSQFQVATVRMGTWLYDLALDREGGLLAQPHHTWPPGFEVEHSLDPEFYYYLDFLIEPMSDGVYERSDARDVARYLRSTIRRFDTLPYSEVEREYQVFYFANSPTGDRPACDFILEEDRSLDVPLPDYKDSWSGSFYYELGVASHYQEGEFHYHLVGRFPGEERFTAERGREAACHWEEVYYPRHEKAAICSDSIPSQRSGDAY